VAQEAIADANQQRIEEEAEYKYDQQREDEL